MKRIENCPACDGSEKASVVELNPENKRRFHQYSQIKYNGLMDHWPERIEIGIDKCFDCGHHWYREQPDDKDLASMYAGGSSLNSQNVDPVRSPSPAMAREISKVMRVSNGAKRFLDYGSGFGRWARAGVEAGLSVTAYEPSLERGAENEDVGFSLIHDKSCLADKKYDIINLQQVLEHVRNPYAVLTEILKYCTPDALVRITVPNILRCHEGDGLWKEWPFDGKRNHTMAPFQHLHGFTPKSLRTLIQRAGYRTMSMWKIFCYSPSLLLRNLLGCFFPKLGSTYLLIKPSRN